MFITTVVADAFATKCYLVAAAEGGDCVVVDPGYGVSERLGQALDRHGLTARAVLLTHGHLDHTYSVPAVEATHRLPIYLHPADHHMLADPFSGLGDEFGPQFAQLLGPEWTWRQPHDVHTLSDGDLFRVSGLEIRVDHTPGHTPGSVMFNLPGDRPGESYCLVGDTLYAGTIGRTDMPGGSRAQTLHSLRGLLRKADQTVLLTGHGEDTTVGRERFANQFMVQASSWDGTGEPPRTIMGWKPGQRV
ncbi:MBL fold metallo-hydrolase [Micromonospora sp. DT229]|uniref:MBL fold metallo-hydrolase n=1 Tax=Micromonospora sp. DT229 TaxID=3393430 RepID=UPI003CEC46A9